MVRKNLNETDFNHIVTNSKSIADICRHIGIVAKGGNYKTVKQLLIKYSCDTSHFTGCGWNQGDRYRQIKLPAPIESILIKGSVYPSYTLKKRLFNEGYKEKLCEICGLDSWLGNPIKLELHHVNGDSNDNRIENLQILCPNCHSYTSNYRGANKLNRTPPTEVWLNRPFYCKNDSPNNIKGEKKPVTIKQCRRCNKDYRGSNAGYCSLECYRDDNSINVPKVPELLERFKTLKSFIGVGKFYGVSDNAVRKWCAKYGIEDLVKKKSDVLA
ncbi:HNH endonuclease [Candidatus Dojkabacteria bacterium]|uniref:HNH endonuclease n=1 Tax=Candidatus Dojkabacteria bacterium TaxID=2099670 RepID=A0A5C7J4L3_9BACT|nr:MAG: HNH endonuclease [Candidatus Dojkabacteria bacterium]